MDLSSKVLRTFSDVDWASGICTLERDPKDDVCAVWKRVTELISDPFDVALRRS